MRSASLLAVVVLVVVGAALPIQSAFAATISLTIAPNPASEDGGGTLVTFSGTEVPAKNGATIYIGIFGVAACIGEPGITRSTTELSSGAYSLVLTTGDIGGVGYYSVLAYDPSTNALSSCHSFVISPFSVTSGGTFGDQSGQYLLVNGQTGQFQITSATGVLLCSGVGAQITNGGLMLSIQSSSWFGSGGYVKCQAGVYRAARASGMMSGIVTVVLSSPTKPGYPAIMVLSMSRAWVRLA